MTPGLVCLGLVSVLLFSPRLDAAVAEKFLVVPAHSVGPIKLGMTRQSTDLSMWSAFQVRAIQGGENKRCWLSRAICVGYFEEEASASGFAVGTVATITLEKDRRFRTREGVGIGSDGDWALRQLSASLGNPYTAGTSDGAIAVWPGLFITLKSIGGSKFSVSSMLVSPAPTR